MKEKIEAILAKHLTGFWFTVTPWTVLGSNDLAIKIATKDYLINGVSGQRPDCVSLALDLDTLELSTQIYAGNGGGNFYRKPDPNHPKEKYLAMQRVKVPFRTPQKTEVAVLKAIENFVIRYKQLLKENRSELMYDKYVNYDSLLG